MRRRTFLAAAAAATAACTTPVTEPAPPQDPQPLQAIDTHIHLFDTEREQGVPWPPKDDPVKYKPTLPSRFRETVEGLHVEGAVAVEASPWVEDNRWLLETAHTDSIMVGVVGNLEPGTPDFPSLLEELASDSLFKGIRSGNLWGRDFHAGVRSDAYVSDVAQLAEAGLSLDSANPSVGLLEDVLVLTDKVPTLQVVLDHLPKLFPPPDEAARFTTVLREISQRPNIAVKVSAVLRPGEGYDLAVYKDKLDEMWETFGADRVLYGSDWPNSLPLGSYKQVLAIVQEYFATKSPQEQAKYFRENAKRVYRL